MRPDWRLFPPELLQLISEKLPSIVDYVRFRAVCPAWRSASSPRRLPPQLPWLIVPRGTSLDSKEADLESSLCVYDLSQSKTHTLHLPEIHGKHICGSSHGWLVLYKDKEAWLCNPITRHQISLPSISAHHNFFHGNHSNINVPNYGSQLCIKKAILSSNPSLDPNCLVMALFSGPLETAFCRIGDDCWTILTLRQRQFRPLWRVVDIVYHNDLFYAITGNGHAWSYDIHKPFCKHISSTLDANDEHRIIDYICTVEGGCDEHGLMIISRDYWQALRQNQITMSVFHMLSDEQEIWSNLKEEHRSSYCFFFGGNFHCISLPLASLQLHGWEGNCICYTSPQFEKRIDDDYWCSCSIKLYRFDDQTVTTLERHLGFFHQCNARKPYFLWLTPTLC